MKSSIIFHQRLFRTLWVYSKKQTSCITGQWLRNSILIKKRISFRTVSFILSILCVAVVTWVCHWNAVPKPKQDGFLFVSWVPVTKIKPESLTLLAICKINLAGMVCFICMLIPTWLGFQVPFTDTIPVSHTTKDYNKIYLWHWGVGLLYPFTNTRGG